MDREREEGEINCIVYTESGAAGFGIRGFVLCWTENCPWFWAEEW